MKSYLSFFKLKFVSQLQYRASAIAGISTQFFFGMVYVMVFMAFFRSGSTNTSMTLTQTVTYLWLNQSFFSMINQYYRDSEVTKIITNGNIAYELARPKNIYFLWLSRIMGGRLAALVLRFIPVLIIASILPEPYNISLPASPLNLLMFVLTLITGYILSSVLSTLYPVLTTRTLNEKGVVLIITSLADIFSGLVVPIPFFPKFLQTISNYLPFQYISDLPFRLYVGNIGIEEGISVLAIQVVWIIALIGISYYLLNKSLKRVVVQGG